MNNKLKINSKNIKENIHTIRKLQVMIDRDLAELYEVKTKALNQAVKRNIERFPKDFMFQLTEDEKNELVTKCDHLKSLKFSYQNPYVFTEQGVAMLSTILKSKKAIEVNIQIIRIFIELRKFISSNNNLFQKIDSIEKKQLEYEINTNKKIEEIFKAIENKDIKPNKGIFFDGQIFDAYNFVSDLIRNAEKYIILIDNYIDDSVLTLFSKRKENVKMIIYTRSISKQLRLDLKKYNSQYSPIKVKEFKDSHDRFLIIDNEKVYHIGASLKDLGRRWFAFSKFDKNSLDVLKFIRKLF